MVDKFDFNSALEDIKCVRDGIKSDEDFQNADSGLVMYYLNTIIQALEIATTVKRGKWEWEPGYVGTTAKCSVCGLSPRGFYSLPISQIGRLPEYKFCPNCGAKMDGGDADADS